MVSYLWMTFYCSSCCTQVLYPSIEMPTLCPATTSPSNVLEYLNGLPSIDVSLLFPQRLNSTLYCLSSYCNRYRLYMLSYVLLHRIWKRICVIEQVHTNRTSFLICYHYLSFYLFDQIWAQEEPFIGSESFPEVARWRQQRKCRPKSIIAYSVGCSWRVRWACGRERIVFAGRGRGSQSVMHTSFTASPYVDVCRNLYAL